MQGQGSQARWVVVTLTLGIGLDVYRLLQCLELFVERPPRPQPASEQPDFREQAREAALRFGLALRPGAPAHFLPPGMLPSPWSLLRLVPAWMLFLSVAPLTTQPAVMRPERPKQLY